MRTYLRSLDPRLPRDVWLLQIGGVMNSLGNGILLPFLVIYLHDVRGFSLGVAGLIVSVAAATQFAGVLVVGSLVDRISPRLILGVGLVLQTVGIGLFPLVRQPWEAFALIAVEGVGSAGFWPSQSTLIARLAPPDRLHAAYAQQRLTMNLGIGLGGVAGGFIAHVAHPGSFTVLFELDALTFLVYVAVLRFVAEPPPAAAPPGARRSSYRTVLRHRTFLGLWLLNFLFVAAGYSLLNLLPQFARDHSHISEREIGLIFAVDTFVIVVVQLPASRWIEGRRRMRALALMPALWAVAWLLVDGAGAWTRDTEAFALFALAAGILGVGECVHGPAHQALVANIGPAALRGRYFAVHSASWGLAGTVGPAVGGFILASEPFALWPLASGVCAVAAIGSLALERYVPLELRRVPHSPVAPAL